MSDLEQRPGSEEEENEAEYHRQMADDWRCYYQQKHKLSPVYQVCDYCGYGNCCPYGPHSRTDWDDEVWLACQGENLMAYETESEDGDDETR